MTRRINIILGDIWVICLFGYLLIGLPITLIAYSLTVLGESYLSGVTLFVSVVSVHLLLVFGAPEVLHRLPIEYRTYSKIKSSVEHLLSLIECPFYKSEKPGFLILAYLMLGWIPLILAFVIYSAAYLFI
ncbi:hypothetical protein [Aliagarivorans taiwanensis]|uniref:hypothetical protein n=1 Tax=Aliagarivorans taiwanensis TaxID=561966 RepID=UPI000550D95D|nr:hypothetical protein [Aliagarivorans taiwanensis]